MQPEAHSILSPAQVALLAQHPELASAFDQYSRDNAELERKNSQLHDRCRAACHSLLAEKVIIGLVLAWVS